MPYKVMLGIDALVALVVLCFFVIGIADGSVSSFNIVLWLVILGVLAAVLGGGFALHRQGRNKAALAVLAIVAIPGLLYGLFVLSILILQPRWN
ncbi:MAG TPA: osmoprotectant transporter permease [Casimicrobiaceae bacterium]|nr:osmoprotectant transporter permease [Casimicrobiaceae bacterium]